MAAAVARAIMIRTRREGRLQGEIGKVLLTPAGDSLNAVSAEIKERPPAAAIDSMAASL